MGICFDSVLNRDVYCTSHLSTYVAAGVLIPVIIFIVIGLVYVFYRLRKRIPQRVRNSTMTPTVVSIYNPFQTQRVNDSFGGFEKPPSYEQTIQELSEAQIHQSSSTTNSPIVRDSNFNAQSQSTSDI